MMEVCSDADDSQTAKLNEFVLVAHRIRKAGRGTRPGLSKFKLRPRNGGNARASSPTGGKNLLAANGSIVSASPELSEAPATPISPHSGETICEVGRIASSDQATSISLQDRSRPQQTSEEEQAPLLRSDGGPRGELLQRSYPPAAPLDIATIRGLRTPQTNSIAPQDRPRLQQTSKEKQASLLRSDGGPRGELLQRSHSASAPLEVAPRILESTIEGAEGLSTHQVPPKGVSSPPPRQVRSFFCICWFGKELGDLGSCCCQAVGEGRPLRRQGKSAEDERHATQELDQLSDDPLPPNSDRATRQRDRCCFPRRGSIPRPITSQL